MSPQEMAVRQLAEGFISYRFNHLVNPAVCQAGSEAVWEYCQATTHFGPMDVASVCDLFVAGYKISRPMPDDGEQF